MSGGRPTGASAWSARRTRWVVVGLVSVALIVAIGVTIALTGGRTRGPDDSSKTFIVAGTVRLFGQPGVRDGQACSGSGGDGDLREGAVVVVYGDNDEKLGIGHLTDGVGVSEGGAVSCVWKFFVPDVSADSDSYFVEVTDRGRHRYDTSEIHGRVDLYVKAR